MDNYIFSLVNSVDVTGSNWELLVLLAGWSFVAAGAAGLAYVGYCASRNGRALAGARARLEKIGRRERLARLRHRDFAAFCVEVNNMRAQRKEKAIPVELLKKVQFNLMYTIDED
jgi:hypothetical protein